VAKPRRKLDALMFRPPAHDAAPNFKVCELGEVAYFRRFGWILLASELDVRMADLDDTRRADENKWRRE
jgi:hypothetical protein